MDIGARIVTAVLAADIITLLFIIHGRVRREHSSPCHVCGQKIVYSDKELRSNLLAASLLSRVLVIGEDVLLGPV